MMIVIIILVILLIAGYLFFKKKGLQAPTQDDLQFPVKDLLNAEIEFFQKLDDKGKERFEVLTRKFLADVRIEGVGTEVTNIDRVQIASSAIIPIFGFPEWNYTNLTNIILYPDTFDKDFQFNGENRNIMGMVGTGFMNGQMLLSRQALSKGFSASSGKENAALHEFVHLLDKSDGATDGIPEHLLAHEYAVPWLKMMHQEMHRIESGKSDINPYALTNEAEFLAVASEYFFEKPDKFQKMHPELYTMLGRIFNQHPKS